MNLKPRLRLYVTAACLFAVLGCQKALKDERTVSVKPGHTNAIILDAPIREQKVNVDAKSPGMPVDIFVVLEEDMDKALKAGEDAHSSKKAPPNTLASKLNAEEASLDVTIPANKGFAIIINNDINAKKEAAVKLKAVSK